MIYWDDWNRNHIAIHGVDPDEATWVTDNREAPFPESVGNEKYRVWGQTEQGRYLQVIFVYHPVAMVDPAQLTLEQLLELEKVDEVFYVVHARDLNLSEKRRYRRRKSS